MKKIVLTLSALMLIMLGSLQSKKGTSGIEFGLYSSSESANDKPKLRVVKNTAFKKGEVLRYKLHYGMLEAGVAELRVKDIKTKKGRHAFHIVGTGNSVGMFNWFYKVEDRYETFIDTSAIVPWEHIRDVNEGGYKINHHVFFNQFHNYAESAGNYYAVPPNVQDILSAFYYSRTYDASTLRIGDEIEIVTFLDHEVWPMKLKFLGRGNVKSEVGTIPCMKFRPVIQVGRVFKDQEGMTIWVSDDQNKIPILLQTDLLIGSIKMSITGYENLRKPLRKI